MGLRGVLKFKGALPGSRVYGYGCWKGLGVEGFGLRRVQGLSFGVWGLVTSL